MTTVLALEAASTCCSVALMQGDAVLERCNDVPREHSRVLLPYVDTLLREAGLQLQDVDVLAVGRGPGSFTGVRAAIATVQGLAFGSGIPVVAVSTLRVLAASARRVHGATRCLALLDARMNEVYCAAYADDREAQAESLLAPEHLTVPPEWLQDVDWLSVGSGLHYADRIPKKILAHAPTAAETLWPSARDLAALAAESCRVGQVLTDPADLQPVYLRDQVVHVPG